MLVVVVFDVYTRAPSGLLHDFDVSTGGGKVLRSAGKWIGGTSSGKRFETRGVHTHQPIYIYMLLATEIKQTRACIILHDNMKYNNSNGLFIQFVDGFTATEE